MIPPESIWYWYDCPERNPFMSWHRYLWIVHVFQRVTRSAFDNWLIMWVNDVHSLVLVFVKTWLPPSSSLQMLGKVSLKKMIYKWVAKGGGEWSRFTHKFQKNSRFTYIKGKTSNLSSCAQGFMKCLKFSQTKA